MAFPALLDACVLYPVGLRDLLLSVAERAVYTSHWTEAILDEMARNIVSDGGSTAEKIATMRQQMAAAFPDALIEGYEQLVPVMTNHPKDRHVLAAAVRGNVGLIVTENVRDFPESACAPYDIEVQTADEFLSYAFDQDPLAVVGAVHAMAGKGRNPPMTAPELLVALAGRLATFTSEATPLLGSVLP
ncbi:MAG: PIN domain-containing protein [Acidimicrobiales bacterium]